MARPPACVVFVARTHGIVGVVIGIDYPAACADRRLEIEFGAHYLLAGNGGVLSAVGRLGLAGRAVWTAVRPALRVALFAAARLRLPRVAGDGLPNSGALQAPAKAHRRVRRGKPRTSNRDTSFGVARLPLPLGSSYVSLAST